MAVYRFPEASGAIWDASSPAVTDAFAVLTELGGVPFFVVLLSALYWVDDRETAATVIGYALVAVAVTLTLKELFALPRPPASVRAVAETPDSFGFPSGHAIAATVVYGGFVLVDERLRDTRSVLAAVALVFFVGLSRVVIGVHYLGDVLAGWTVGAVVLGVLWRTVDHRADLACLIAGAGMLAAVGLTGGDAEPVAGFVASLAGAYAFWRSEGYSFSTTPRSR